MDAASDAAAATDAPPPPPPPQLELARHVGYLKYILKLLPSQVASSEVNRMTLVFFSLCGLDVLGALESATSPAQRQAIVDWIYAQQVTSQAPTGATAGGFRGGPFLGQRHGAPAEAVPLDYSNIAMTYTALACLVMLGDDLARVDRAAVVAGLKQLQRADGSFCAMYGGSENDMRFLYCACVISHIVNDWSGVDRDRAVRFVRESHAYDFGIAQGPGQEAHGGSTYCAVAALQLMGRLDDGLLDRARTIRFLLQRQETGFNGRPNKIVDTCYAFWVGGTIAMLGAYDLVDRALLTGYLFSCQQKTGGFSKWPENTSDPLHTYFGLAGLSLAGHAGLQPIDAALDLTLRAKQHIASTVFWR